MREPDSFHFGTVADNNLVVELSLNFVSISRTHQNWVLELVVVELSQHLNQNWRARQAECRQLHKFIRATLFARATCEADRNLALILQMAASGQKRKRGESEDTTASVPQLATSDSAAGTSKEQRLLARIGAAKLIDPVKAEKLQIYLERRLAKQGKKDSVKSGAAPAGEIASKDSVQLTKKQRLSLASIPDEAVREQRREEYKKQNLRTVERKLQGAKQ